MDKTIAEVLETLKCERVRLLSELYRVDAAITALDGGAPSKTASKSSDERKTAKNIPTTTVENFDAEKRVQWASAVRSVFAEHNNLRPVDIIGLLVEQGIEGLDNPDIKKKVYVTLARMANKGELNKTEDGLYCRANG